MRVKTFYRILRFVSAAVLFFVIWTFGPAWQAFAFVVNSQKADARGQSADSRHSNGAVAQKPEERFEKALEDIREKVGRAGEKAGKDEDYSAEQEAIRAKKSEVDSLANELRTSFAETDRKLKAAGLPKTILTRHSDFVALFERNIKELRDNLDGIEAAKTSTDRKATIEKARLHLEKTKPQRHHTPLNPNQLPNRNRQATKTVEPRLKKEDFERDFPKQKSQSKKKLADNRLFDNLLAKAPQPKPIILAFNGPESDIPVSFSAQPSTPQFAFADSTPYLLALASDQPTADDLSETPEVQFTDAIRAKAQELGGNPVRIYEWVRSNIEYAPLYGSIQGADMCLQSKICNDFDTASLLISLLRVSGIYSHYEYSTIELPIEKAMNWVGGVTDPKMVGTILATNSIPVKMLVSGGTYKSIQLEHVYARAFIDMIPSRGAVHKQGDSWVSLDASYKQYTYLQGIDMASAVPFDAQSFTDQISSTATINEADGSVTNVNSTLIQTTMQDYQTQVQNYIQQNHPSATVGDVIGKKEIIKQEFPILMGTLPYKTVQVGAKFAEVPSSYRATMSFSIPDAYGDAGLSYSTTLPQIAGKKITLSFTPATDSDQKIIESYMPKAHSDGSAINLSELPISLPAYLINLKPELRVDGQVVATGSSTMMGKEQLFTMSLNEPGIGASNIENTIQTGEYFGIGVDTGRIGADHISALKAKLESLKSKLEARTFDGLTKDDIVGGILCTTIAAYFAELDAADEITARTSNIIRYRAPSVGMFFLALNINELYGIPKSAGPKGMMMDVDRTMQAVFGKDGTTDRARQYMLSSGVNGSSLEHAVPEQLFSTPTNSVHGISAVKTLQTANDQGIPIYTINQTNVNTILPLLQLNGDVKNDIQNAVNAGKTVNVSKTNVTYNGWTGCGYIIVDPTTGAGAYMISDGFNGGGFMYWFWTIMWGLSWIMLIGLVVLILPELIAGLSAIAESLSAVYLLAGISTASYIATNEFLAPLYDILMLWVEYSPPPAPVPTTPGQAFMFFSQYYFLFFYKLYHETYGYIFNTIEYAYYSLQNWKFVMKHAILTC